MEPKIGDVVHYVSYGTPGGEYDSKCRAALVTEVTGQPDPAMDAVYDPDNSWIVGLAVLNPEGMFFKRELDQAEHYHAGGTWHFPCGK